MRNGFRNALGGCGPSPYGKDSRQVSRRIRARFLVPAVIRPKWALSRWVNSPHVRLVRTPCDKEIEK